MPLEAPTPRQDRPGLLPQLRSALGSLMPYADAVWQHLRNHWTDALLAVGFVFVILLSTYLLMKG